MKTPFLIVVTAAAMSSTQSIATTVPHHSRARAEHEHEFTVARPLPEAFSFFEPIGEKRWAEGWQPTFVSAADAELREGSVFTVPTQTPAGKPVEAVWAISRFEPPHRIEYRNVIPGVRATCVNVRCVAAAPGRTRVTVRYVYHALSDDGDAFVAAMTPEKYRAMIDSWGAAIAAYLRRGTPASP